MSARSLPLAHSVTLFGHKLEFRLALAKQKHIAETWKSQRRDSFDAMAALLLLLFPVAAELQEAMASL